VTREQALTEARNAAGRAKTLAGDAENAAHNAGRCHLAPYYAAAGALWADTARAYTAIAQALPETTTED
jgi:hypothetical protein